MNSDPGPYTSSEALAVLWVTAVSPQRIAARLCTAWAANLADRQADEYPWPEVLHAATELHTWACRPDDREKPAGLIAELEAAASSVGRGLDCLALQIAVDSCLIEAAHRSGRIVDSDYEIEAHLALRSYVAVFASGALPPSLAMRHVVDAVLEGEPDEVREVAASLLAEWEGDLSSLLIVSRRLAAVA